MFQRFETSAAPFRAHLIVLAVAGALAAPVAAAETPGVAALSAEIRVEADGGSIAGQAELRFAEPTPLPVTLRLGADYRIEQAGLPAADGTDPAALAIEPGAPGPDGLRPWLLGADRAGRSVSTLRLAWRGAPPPLDPSLDPGRPGSVVRRERGFRAPGLLALPWSSGWLPRGNERSRKVRLEVTLPRGWDAAGPGRGKREAAPATEGRRRVRFEPAEPLRWPGLAAGRWTASHREHRGVTLAVCHDGSLPATAVAATLEHVIAILDRLTAAYGPHPGAALSLVAAPFDIETGTPGLRLVGADALARPEAARERLARALAADWWGLGVAVPPGEGDWASALALYTGAHDEAARRDPPGDARLRRDWRERAARLAASIERRPLARTGADAPPAAREAARLEGALVFHMLRAEVGEEAFVRALRALLAARRDGEARWSDLRAAFERASGRKLDWFWRQWIAGTERPHLALAKIEPGRPLAVELAADPPFRLHVPVEVVGEDGERLRRTALIAAGRSRLRIGTRFRPRRVIVDPDADVLRRLDREEWAATFDDLFEQGADLIVVGTGRDGSFAAAARTLSALLGPGARVVFDFALDEAQLHAARRVWLVGRPHRSVARLFPLPGGARLGDHSLAVGGVRADDGPALALAARGGEGRLLGFIDALEPGAAVQIARRLRSFGWASWLLLERDRVRLARIGPPGAFPLARDLPRESGP